MYKTITDLDKDLRFSDDS